MIIEKFKGLIDFNFVALNLIIAFVLFFIDKRALNQKGLEKERKIVVGLSVALVIIGPLAYILTLVL